MLLAAALAVAGVFAPAASAQGEPTCVITFVEDVEDVEVMEETPTPVPTFFAITDSENSTAAENTTVGSANATAVHACADAQTYPGPFTNMPVTPASPYSAPLGLTANDSVADAPAAAETSTPGLAHSGSEVFVLAYLGTGLLAFGAVALGIRRGARIA